MTAKYPPPSSETLTACQQTAILVLAVTWFSLKRFSTDMVIFCYLFVYLFICLFIYLFRAVFQLSVESN